jgi:hypothetical protein
MAVELGKRHDRRLDVASFDEVTAATDEVLANSGRTADEVGAGRWLVT